MDLRYAILHHTGLAEPHFDLLFEPAPGQPLRAFRAAAWPLAAPADLVPLPDHRALYLTYEGPISDNRGHVVRVEGGAYRIDAPWPDAGSMATTTHRITLLGSGRRFTLQLGTPPRLIP